MWLPGFERESRRFHEGALAKGRLVAPYPSRWAQFDLKQLEALCRAAQPVGHKRIVTPSSERMVTVEHAADRRERADAEREFSSPRGRLWTVRVHECIQRDGSNDIVLRFTAGDTVVDLKDWPPDWKELSREEYALLLLDAEPPRQHGNPGPQRRREDRPSD